MTSTLKPSHLSGPYYITQCEICLSEASLDKSTPTGACNMARFKGWRLINSKVFCPACIAKLIEEINKEGQE